MGTEKEGLAFHVEKLNLRNIGKKDDRAHVRTQYTDICVIIASVCPRLVPVNFQS